MSVQSGVYCRRHSAVALPETGYFELERGRYGPVYPRTPACYGFSIIAKVKEGREAAVRAYGKQIEETMAGSPDVLAPLRLHYLRWVLFDVGSGLHFQRWARHALDMAQSARGVFQFEGIMVDAPVLRRAERIVALAPHPGS